MARRKREEVRRHPSGRINYGYRKDSRLGPTLEQTLKRMALVGPDADDKFAESPIGVVYVNGGITEAEMMAGLRYFAVYWAIYGFLSPSKSTIGDIIDNGSSASLSYGGENDVTEIDEATQEAVNAMTRVLMGCGRRSFDCVQNVVLHYRWPRWLLIGRRYSPEQWRAAGRDYVAFRKGLTALAAAFGGYGELADRGSEERAQAAA